MNSNVNVQNFLLKHNFSTGIADNLHTKIIEDMQKGLSTGNADQAMIKAGSAAVRTIHDGETAIVIDAGGTNFRSSLVTKTQDGISISHFEKTSMPAIDRELNKTEFYKAIADNISRLKGLSDKISFCFSYAMEITPDGDGKILRFSKEIKAEQAVGNFIGKELSEELKRQGWNSIKKINVLNDTTALLLSSFADQTNKKGGTHLAYILGTGMNSAYISNNTIIVTECGMFSNLKQSDFDLIVTGRTTQPENSIIEKMSSGAYLGDIAFEMLKAAHKEGLFSSAFVLPAAFATKDFDAYFLKDENQLSEDEKIVKELLFTIITRSAYLSAETIYAAILCADKEKEEIPVCITCNGSTFWKTPLLKQTAEARLKSLLKQPFEIIQIADDITKGSFAASFIA